MQAILITTGEKAVTVNKIPPYSTLKSDKITIKKVEKMHKFFEYSDYVDSHSDMEDWEFKQTLLTAFCAEIGLHIGLLEKAMRFEEITYDDIIV